jgi:hypothetical protein
MKQQLDKKSAYKQKEALPKDLFQLCTTTQHIAGKSCRGSCYIEHCLALALPLSQTAPGLLTLKVINFTTARPDAPNGVIACRQPHHAHYPRSNHVRNN